MAWFWPILAMVMIVVGLLWIWQWGGIWFIVGGLVELGGWAIFVMWLRARDGFG